MNPIKLLIILGLAAFALSTLVEATEWRRIDEPTSKPSASVSTSASDSSRAYGFGSGSPSANACQRIILFGFSADVVTCQLQQWAVILGDNPSDARKQVACQDELLARLPLCKGYQIPALPRLP